MFVVAHHRTASQYNTPIATRQPLCYTYTLQKASLHLPSTQYLPGWLAMEPKNSTQEKRTYIKQNRLTPLGSAFFGLVLHQTAALFFYKSLDIPLPILQELEKIDTWQQSADLKLCVRVCFH